MTKYVISAGYDNNQNAVFLKLYDEKTQKLEEWFDDTYKPYCLSDKIDSFNGMGVTNITTVTKYDALNDSTITMQKGTFNIPNDVKKTQINDDEFNEEFPKFWENHLKIQMSYIYDEDIKMGMPYNVSYNQLFPLSDIDADNRTTKLLDLFTEKSITKDLIKLFEYPAPNFKRASLDIEVLNEEKKMPRPEIANYPVICVCIKTTEGKRIAFLLTQPNKTFDKYPDVDELYTFSDEKDLLLELFKYIQQFPFLITFNGDGFDLMYLRNRAYRFGIQNEYIPLIPSGNATFMRSTIHIDLYRFFQITAIKNYAFQGKYKEVSLDTLSKLLLKKGKFNEDKRMVGEMDYNTLVNYCMRDAELTLELTTFDDNLVINLMTAISRISRMPIEECSRKAVGRWIASFLFYQHRRLNYLIPNPSDILAMKGKVSSIAKVKGKQYEGAMVIKPKGGIPFGVQDIDYGSLYPSVIKWYNIGYATINCPHPECKSNIFGGLPHWICKKHDALESIFIGALRDLRLSWYKKQSKSKELTDSQRSWYKCIEQVIKVFMNASYGVFAAEGGFAFGCPPVSEEIAGISRSIIQATAKQALDMGIEVIYGDTDSLFIRKTDKIGELQKWAFEQYKIDLELDKEYRFMCFSSRKKNYIGVQLNGEIDIKGMTGKKSHTPTYFKNAFNEIKSILKNVQKEDEIPAAKTAIIKIAFTSYKNLKNRKWNNIEDLAFHMTVNKKLSDYGKKTDRIKKDGSTVFAAIPQHIRAVRLLEKQGYAMESGSVISFVKTKTDEGVLPLELAENNDVDVDKYIKFLNSMLGQVLDPLELEMSEILGHKKLDSFFQKT
jgi:DNA polymerase I